MQKKIIALAVAAAFSTPAFADVGFYGIVDGGVLSISAKNQKTALIAVSGAASQSRLGVKATEDLGNGLTGIAVVEYGIDTQTSDNMGATTTTSRQKFVAVAGDFGTVSTGYLQTAVYDFLAKYDPLYGSGSSAHSIIAKGHLVGSAGQRAQRVVAYSTPNISGAVFAVNYVTALTGNALNQSDVAPTNNFQHDSALMLSANYAIDALSVGAVYATSDAGKNAAANGPASSLTAAAAGMGIKTTEFAFAGSYDLGVAKVMGTYQSSKTDAAGAKADTLFSLAGLMPISTGVLGVLYASGQNAESASASATALTAGYLHTFTKSTTGYVVFSNVKNGSASTGYSVGGNALTTGWGVAGAANVNNGASSTLFGVGIRKKF
ncbi:MAG: porin [Sideroxydans sp.]